MITINPHQCKKDFDYLLNVSIGGLIFPSVDLAHYVSKSFAMLDVAKKIISATLLNERNAAEGVLTLNSCAQSFLCDKHTPNI